MALRFSDLLLNPQETFVTWFYDALNKGVEKGQMWFSGWGSILSQSYNTTHYLTTVVLLTATTFCWSFNKACLHHLQKISEVFVDGLSVKIILFWKKLKYDMKTNVDWKGGELTGLGTCSFHVVHGSWKGLLLMLPNTSCTSHIICPKIPQLGVHCT